MGLGAAVVAPLPAPARPDYLANFKGAVIEDEVVFIDPSVAAPAEDRFTYYIITTISRNTMTVEFGVSDPPDSGDASYVKGQDDEMALPMHSGLGVGDRIAIWDRPSRAERAMLSGPGVRGMRS